MIMLNLFMVIITIHWIADFVLQSHWMATNKSKSLYALSAHVITYTITFFIILSVYLHPLSVFMFCIVNGVLHFITDFFTSKITSYLYKKQDIHNFFVVVGLDQLIHYFCLYATIPLIIGKF